MINEKVFQKHFTIDLDDVEDEEDETESEPSDETESDLPGAATDE